MTVTPFHDRHSLGPKKSQSLGRWTAAGIHGIVTIQYAWKDFTYQNWMCSPMTEQQKETKQKKTSVDI